MVIKSENKLSPVTGPDTFTITYAFIKCNLNSYIFTL